MLIGRDLDCSLFDAILINFFAASLIFFLASAFLFCQLEAPNLSKLIEVSSKTHFTI